MFTPKAISFLISQYSSSQPPTHDGQKIDVIVYYLYVFSVLRKVCTRFGQFIIFTNIKTWKRFLIMCFKFWNFRGRLFLSSYYLLCQYFPILYLTQEQLYCCYQEIIIFEVKSSLRTLSKFFGYWNKPSRNACLCNTP